MAKTKRLFKTKSERKVVPLTRTIAFIAILIAITVTFTIILIKIAPILSIPTFKNAVIGLPTKVVGFVFGSAFGIFVAVASDFITFILAPTFFHPAYTLALAFNGFLAGLSATSFAFLRRSYLRKKRLGGEILKSGREQEQEREQAEIKLFNRYLILTFFFLIIAIIVIIGFILAIPEKTFTLSSSFVNSRSVYTLLLLSSPSLFLLILIVFAFLLNNSRFSFYKPKLVKLLPVIVLVVLAEIPQDALIAWGDSRIFGSNFFDLLISHTLSASLKMWVNLVVISTTLSIILKIVKRRDPFNRY